MSDSDYVRLLLHKAKDRELIYWLCDEKWLYESMGRAMRRKLYLLMAEAKGHLTIREGNSKERKGDSE